MIKDGEDSYGLPTTNLKNLALTFQDTQTVKKFLSDRNFHLIVKLVWLVG